MLNKKEREEIEKLECRVLGVLENEICEIELKLIQLRARYEKLKAHFDRILIKERK